MKFEDLPYYELGNTWGIKGVLLGTEDENVIVMYPDQTPPDGSKAVGISASVLNLTRDEWSKLNHQLDVQEVEVLEKAGPNGELVKSIVRKSQRLIEQRVSWAVFKRDNYTCRYCGRDGVPMTVDHLVLWEAGGPSVENNLTACCRKCNKVRGNTEYEEWLKSPYYVQVSKNLTSVQREANLALVPTLDKIVRRYHERSSR